MKLTIKTAEQLEAERAAIQAKDARAQALSYLAETDWYVTRQIETGKPVPDDVAVQREAARKLASA